MMLFYLETMVYIIYHDNNKTNDKCSPLVTKIATGEEAMLRGEKNHLYIHILVINVIVALLNL